MIICLNLTREEKNELMAILISTEEQRRDDIQSARRMGERDGIFTAEEYEIVKSLRDKMKEHFSDHDYNQFWIEEDTETIGTVELEK